MNRNILVLISLLFLGCSERNFKGTKVYYNGKFRIEFSKYDYVYLKKSHMVIEEFSHGKWENKDGQIILYNQVKRENELPIEFSEVESTERYNIIVIDIAKTAFDFEEDPVEFFNLELYINDVKSTKIDSMLNFLITNEKINNIYIKAIINPDKGVWVLNDTLVSNIIIPKNKDVFNNYAIRLTSDLLDFYKVALPVDTLKIINKRKLYWKGRDINLKLSE